MSTQYSVVNTRITEEVAEFQKKVSAIRAECLRMMCEASVSADLQEIKEDLIDKLSERALLGCRQAVKAPVSDTGICWFESNHRSHTWRVNPEGLGTAR